MSKSDSGVTIMKTRNLGFLVLLAACVFSPTQQIEAQTKANVSGTWKMNAEKSKFEKEGPKSILIKFNQQATTLSEEMTLGNEQGDRTISLTYTLDGKESPQQLEGQAIQTFAKWEGETLIIEFKDEQGFNFLRRVTLASDGKTMTMAVKQTNPNGTVSDTVILEKQ
jgi:hypothetical protein